MPWVVKKNDSKYCVYKKDGDTPIKGGCHGTRKEATAHMRALYANVKEFSEAADGVLSMLRPLKFSESEVDNKKLRKWIQAFPYGSWDHPIYGMTHFHKHNAETMKMNFSEKVHGKDILNTDYEHGLDVSKGTKASGTILDMEVREDGMYWFVEFTPQATKEIEDGEWSYFSPEYYEAWDNPMTGEVHADVATGGALTIKPWVKGMMPINLSEVLVEKGVLSRDDQTGEVAWEEHHDPDEDPHTQPKPEDPQGGEDRFDTLPIQREADEDDEQEASVEVTAAMLAALGLPEDATAEQVEEAVTTMATEIAPLREAANEALEVKQFSEKFPEQARQLTETQAELARLRKKDAERDAESFGKSFSEFVVKIPGKNEENEDIELEVRKGFSTAVCDNLTELHKKFSEGTANADDLRPILESIVKGDGIVEYGERGTSTERDDETAAANPQEAAKRLSELAYAEIAAAGGDSKLTFGDAMARVTKANPELAKMYNEAQRKEG